MKKGIIVTIRLVLVLFSVCVFNACKYDEIASSDYPEQKIYFPAAVGGIYHINSLPESTLADPTPGNTFRFTVNTATNEFIIPLAVYRSGINNQGQVEVSLTANNDTVLSQMSANTEGYEGVELLATNKLNFPTNVVIQSGSELVKFDLKIDLNYLKVNSDKKFAFALNLASTKLKSTISYSTVIVIVDTKILKPISFFTSNIDISDTKKVVFNNESSYYVSCLWEFGDGFSSQEKNPVHIYNAAGNYNVKLSAIGITGDSIMYNSTLNIVN